MHFLEFMAHPSIAYYMLLLLGVYGIFFELVNPGFIVPGVMGAVALCVALYALYALPMYYFVFVVMLVAIVLIVGGYLALRSRRRPVQNGANLLMGASGKTLSLIDLRGQAMIHGEIWSVYSKYPIRSERPIKVIAINGICLEIEEQLDEGE